MQDPATIRFLASNYFFLQGLRLIPVGLVSLVLAAWANTDRTTAQDGGFLIWCYLVAIGGYLLVGREYRRDYGSVRVSRRQMMTDLAVFATATVLAWITFWLDAHASGPVSYFGLFIAIGLVVDYLRMTWVVRGRYLWIQPVFAGVVLTLSLLGLAGGHGWWLWLGMRNASLAILLLTSLFILVEGWVTHRLLVRLMGPA